MAFPAQVSAARSGGIAQKWLVVLLGTLAEAHPGAALMHFVLDSDYM